jgi:hypothetical protein
MLSNKLTDKEKKERKRLADKKRYELNKEKLLEQSKKRKELNKELCSLQNKNYHVKNKEIIKERKRLWYLENKNKIKTTNKIWRDSNKDHLLEYQRNYYNEKIKTDELFRLKHIIKKSIKNSFKRTNHKKSSPTIEILGCSFYDFKNYVESKFELWMNWNNYGLYNGTPKYGWDIDHIIPLKESNTVEDVIKLNHYSNLQPLCSYYNRDIKIDNII